MASITSSFFDDLSTCVQFLSRIPIPQAWARHEQPDFTKSAGFFPLAGLIITLPAVMCLIGGVLMEIPLMVVAALTLCVHVWVTGALHEDGLADCADGFGGGGSKERKLDIMRDSRIGTFGMVALCVIFIFRFALLVSFLQISLGTAIAAFLASQTLSRSVQVYFWKNLPPARAEGLSSRFGAPSVKALQIALGLGTIFTLTFCASSFSAGSTIIALSLAIGVTIAFRAICLKQIGGQTGDTIGAVQIISEIAFLIGLTTFPA